MNKTEIIRGIVIYDDIRELEKKLSKKHKEHELHKEKWYAHQIPPLPEWTNRVYRYKQFKQNPFQLVCNCPDFQEKNKIYIGRDFRKLCYHLYIKLTSTKIKDHLDELTHIILESRFKYGQTKFYKNHFYGTNLILGFNDKNPWINIYLKENETWKRYSYNEKEARWRYHREPENARLLLRRIAEIQVWQLGER